MAHALRLAPWLLIAVAAEPAAAEPQAARLKLHWVDSTAFDDRAWTIREPVLGNRLFRNDGETLPAWTLPFGTAAEERDRRGVTFSIRPGRGLKARAKLRF